MPFRFAITHYEDDWPFGRNPWPWCTMAEYSDLQGNIVPARPHDSHIVNGGNTDCPGHPGVIEVPDTDKALVPSPEVFEGIDHPAVALISDVVESQRTDEHGNLLGENISTQIFLKLRNAGYIQ